ncbi:arsenate reductase family protein [Alicyclobacillus kakegawensis]|uniref:arsenate reductase family protein n=1 Tax=Alicyclobacillus kakegawensis TaxID=392012 RepID=UPI00082EAC9B|nr:Spx/MgsR family RNA polymerase-binding regulatory protein [Alicyclobacillus kakegawensis]
MEFYGYRRCSTCRNAHKYLKEHGIDVEFRDLVDKPPTADQVRRWVKELGQGVEPFLNRRGTRFRELGLKDAQLTEQEWVDRLTSDGKLFKRPIVIADGEVVIGFDKAAYDQLIARKATG